jgi:hypothetical protein
MQRPDTVEGIYHPSIIRRVGDVECYYMKASCQYMSSLGILKIVTLPAC